MMLSSKRKSEKNDEPYFTRKENVRLRKKRYDLAQANPTDTFKIEKGKLLHNGAIVDKFDLNNQIFTPKINLTREIQIGRWFKNMTSSLWKHIVTQRFYHKYHDIKLLGILNFRW